MSQITKFREMRLYANIPLNEVAKFLGISQQRLGQLETRRFGSKPKNPERYIAALETIIKQRKEALNYVEKICNEQRESIFDYMEGGQKL